METIREILSRKLQRSQKGLNFFLIFMGLAVLFLYGGAFYKLLPVIGLVFLFISLPVGYYSGILLYFFIKCPNCRKSLGYHITCKCKKGISVMWQRSRYTFSISKEKIKGCPFCNIDLDTPMSEVKGVKLIPPEYKSFHVYLEEKPYIKKEN